MTTTFICPSIAERLTTVTKLNFVINESGDILEYMPSVVYLTWFHYIARYVLRKQPFSRERFPIGFLLVACFLQ